MNLILMGAPGAGKGTQSEKISEKWGISPVSTGQILRAAIKSGSELGKQAKVLIDAGQFVPDEVVIAIIKETLSTEACKNGFILDGFPRSISQAEALEEMGVHIDCALSLEVSDEVIIERMAGRRLCSKCGASYHIEHMKPKQENICDKCGAALYIRSDDAAETVKSRLEVFHEQTEPLKAFYEERGLLKCVSSEASVDETTALVFEALSEVKTV
jgi:adenylate kinase